MVDPRIYRGFLVVVAFTVIVFGFSLKSQPQPLGTTVAAGQFFTNLKSTMTSLEQQGGSEDRAPGSPGDSCARVLRRPATCWPERLRYHRLQRPQRLLHRPHDRRAADARERHRDAPGPGQRHDRGGQPSRRGRVTGQGRSVQHRGDAGSRAGALRRDPEPLGDARFHQRPDRSRRRHAAGDIASRPAGRRGDRARGSGREDGQPAGRDSLVEHRQADSTAVEQHPCSVRQVRRPGSPTRAAGWRDRSRA